MEGFALLSSACQLAVPEQVAGTALWHKAPQGLSRKAVVFVFVFVRKTLPMAYWVLTCISYFFRDSGKNCKAVAFSKDGSLFAWCNGEKWVHFVILMFRLYEMRGISHASFTIVSVKAIAVNASVCMYTLNGIYQTKYFMFFAYLQCTYSHAVQIRFLGLVVFLFMAPSTWSLGLIY